MRKKRPWTPAEFFDILAGKVKEEGRWPESIDYSSNRSAGSVLIGTEEFDVGFDLSYGGSEGIYLDIYVEGYLDADNPKERTKQRLGTIKTLAEDRDGMHQMAVLGADFIVSGREYVNAHREEFRWVGYSIRRTGSSFSRFTRDKNEIEEIVKQFLEGCESVTVTDHKTKEVSVYTRER